MRVDGSSVKRAMRLRPWSTTKTTGGPPGRWSTAMPLALMPAPISGSLATRSKIVASPKLER